MTKSLEVKPRMTDEERDAEAALAYSIIYNLGRLVPPSALNEGLRLWLHKFYQDIEVAGEGYDDEIKSYCNDILDLQVAKTKGRIH